LAIMALNGSKIDNYFFYFRYIQVFKYSISIAQKFERKAGRPPETGRVEENNIAQRRWGEEK